jgi:hypothetical protein
MNGRHFSLFITSNVANELWEGAITLTDADGKIVETALFVLGRGKNSSPMESAICAIHLWRNR